MVSFTKISGLDSIGTGDIWRKNVFGLHVKKFLVAAAVLVMHQLVCLRIILELLDDRVPDKGTTEFACDDTDIAHRAG